MNSCADLPLSRTISALPDWVQAQIQALQSELAQREAELKRREVKIQQLTLELAHHKRIRFGAKSEAFSSEQRDLFVDAGDEDGAAIAAELAQQRESGSALRRPTERVNDFASPCFMNLLLKPGCSSRRFSPLRVG